MHFVFDLRSLASGDVGAPSCGMGDDCLQPLLRDEQRYVNGEISANEIRVDIVDDVGIEKQGRAAALEWCSEWRFSSEDMPPLPSISSVDPFKNSTHYIRGAWEFFKVIICVPLLVLRVLLVVLILCFGYVCTKLALFGWKQSNKPMPRWRRNVMWGTRLCARSILFCYGFHWIERIGKPAPRDVAPVVVSNHVSFIDPIFYFYELFPTSVSSSSHNDRMFVGTIIRSMQVILVDRLSPNSRRDAISEIKSRAGSNEFPRVLLFPEGTTTNGKALISFKPGAFVAGFPIQPVVVKYPHVHFDISWGSISLARLLPRMLLQFHNFMQVQYLPVIFPSSWERNNPGDYAERVKNTMARALNVPETEHSYGDLVISTRASELKQPFANTYSLEMVKLQTQVNLTTAGALYYLEKFSRMNSARSGLLTKAEFLHSMGISYGSFSDQIFRFFDRRDRGSVTFQEFVLASVCLSGHEHFQRLLASTLNLLSLDEDARLTLDEVERLLRSTFSEATSKKLAGLIAAEGAEEVKQQLCRNPELLFPFALAAQS